MVVNQQLRQLIQRSLEEPDNLEVIGQIRALNMGSDEFSDDLLDSFSSDSRYKIYVKMLLWTDQGNWLKVLRRRCKTEDDSDCSGRIGRIIEISRDMQSGEV
jgi:hypothetical protein